MIGGKLIEKTEKRLWCVGVGADNGMELAVFYENDTKDRLPYFGEEIWWQSGRIYYGKNDEFSLKKIANSHDPQPLERVKQ